MRWIARLIVRPALLVQVLVASLGFGCVHRSPEGLDVVRQDKRREGYRYRLCEAIAYPTPFVGYDLTYRYVQLEADGMLTLDRGFEWNGPTFAPDAAALMRASAFHDALYRIFRAKAIPPEEQFRADQVLHEVASEDGYLGADLALVSVRAFGWMGTYGKARKGELPVGTPSVELSGRRHGCMANPSDVPQTTLAP